MDLVSIIGTLNCSISSSGIRSILFVGENDLCEESETEEITQRLEKNNKSEFNRRKRKELNWCIQQIQMNKDGEREKPLANPPNHSNFKNI